MQELAPLIQLAGIVLGPAGAAYVGIRVALNGTVKRVERLESKVDSLLERTARIEGQHSGGVR